MKRIAAIRLKKEHKERLRQIRDRLQNKPVHSYRHAKPYHPAHLASLLVSILLCCCLVAAMTWYFVLNDQKRTYARSAAGDATHFTQGNGSVTVSSQYGFGFSFDPQQYQTEATVIHQNGSVAVYENNELAEARPYVAVRVAPANVGGRVDTSRLTIITETADVNEADLQQRYGDSNMLRNLLKKYEEQSNDFNIKLLSESNEKLGGAAFLKATYEYAPKLAGTGKLKLSSTRHIVYVGVANKRVYVLRIAGITDSLSPENPFADVVGTFALIFPRVTFEGAIHPLTAAKNFRHQDEERTWADWLFPAEKAHAADQNATDQVAIVARYTPATVRLYSVVCGEVTYLGKSLGSECGGSSGTGFLVSSDGYIATNGHVVSNGVHEIVAESMNFSSAMLEKMLLIEGYSAAQIDAILTELQDSPDKIGALAESIYALPDESLILENEQRFLLVALGNDQPDLQSILTKRQAPSDSTSIKSARVIGVDFNSDDLKTGNFTGSDVALLKIDGSDYPFVRLGSLDTLVKGSTLTVLGYPGIADNQLIDRSEIEATATIGVVSAIRNSNDGKKRLVQSDVKIGHGNSGGPAFDTSGRAVGLATYYFSGAESGDSSVTYVRDIRDFEDLLRQRKINLAYSGKTQQTWEQGLQKFFAAHYTDAIKDFKKVQQLYPVHSLATGYIAIAEAKIRNGEEAKSTWIAVSMFSSLFVVLLVVAATLWLMKRHHAAHIAFRLQYAFPGIPHVSFGSSAMQQTTYDDETIAAPRPAAEVAAPPVTAPAPEPVPVPAPAPVTHHQPAHRAKYTHARRNEY